MVRALERGISIQKLVSGKGYFHVCSRRHNSVVMENGNDGDGRASSKIHGGDSDGRASSKSHSGDSDGRSSSKSHAGDSDGRVAAKSPAGDSDGRPFSKSYGGETTYRPENQRVGCSVGRSDHPPKSRLAKEGTADTAAGGKDRIPSEMEMMKERFAKLLLGEDMSGGGKGVSSALALSNAITNLAASVFGEQWRLEPMSAERKTRWRKEIDWLLTVTDHIVEFVPSQQKSKDGTSMEIMVTRQRIDLLMNIPALRKLDAMLIEYLDNFKDQNEFWYVKRDADDNQSREDDKWWLPKPKVPPEGLSDASRKWLHFQKDAVNQVHKAAMAINAQVLSEMEIPEIYIESLPKNGRASLGDFIYRSITEDFFNPEQFLSTLDLSTEHKVLDIKNRIEASVVIWKRKMNNKDGKSSWGSGVSIERREIFEERAETILMILKQRYPGSTQSALDISKIQYNRDVGHSVLESYSRILESLAFTVMSRIDDVLYADSLTRNQSFLEASARTSVSDKPVNSPVKLPSPQEEVEKPNAVGSPKSMTLSDFMGWNEEPETEAKSQDSNNLEDMLNFPEPKPMKKLAEIVTQRKMTYIERLETLRGLRSPTARH